MLPYIKQNADGSYEIFDGKYKVITFHPSEMVLNHVDKENSNERCNQECVCRKWDGVR